MRKIYCIGETVYDILFQNGKAVESRPGGPVLNTAVSLGKLGEKVYVVGDQADDVIGNIIADFLAANNVSTKYLTLYNGAKSRMLLAFLNDHNEPSYSFYKIRTDDEIKITFPEVRHEDIVLFGSFTSIKKEVRDDFVACIQTAREAGALIIYDPNFRPAHIKLRDKVMDYIYENISLSTIVKGSNEDFQNIFESSTAYAAKDIVNNNGCKNLIYTANKYGVNLFTGDFHKVFDVPRIDPVSTVGAGDNFSAGLIYALIKENVYASDLDNLDHDVWRKIIRVAIDFAIDVCMSYDNYISDDFVIGYVMNGRIKEC
jgi:fructokinase